ncbi:hypothetical protein [Micromonospora fulviviridis]|uniref:Secreted protein n=1 Tax=Micromonospora fulviviridis TaxID=47860 RepID=A0ABV2VDN0_9ACTN
MKWSDAIGPLVGAVSALLAVALGAWWQGRSSVKLVRIQAEEADRVRHAQAEEAERVRQEQAEEAERVRQSQSRHEQLMSLFDDKRASYVHLLTVASNLGEARSELLEDRRLPFGPEAFLDQTLEQRDKDASDDVDAALSMIEILAPREVYDAAVQLCAAELAGRFYGGRVERSYFIGYVRRDLGTEPTPGG